MVRTTMATAFEPMPPPPTLAILSGVQQLQKIENLPQNMLSNNKDIVLSNLSEAVEFIIPDYKNILIFKRSTSMGRAFKKQFDSRSHEFTAQLIEH
jgi:hypothetical protein